MHVRNYVSTHVKTKRYDFFTQVFPNIELEECVSINQGGSALQLSNLSMNVVFACVSRVVLSLQDDGIAASAHSMTCQVFSIGGVVLLDLSVTEQTLVSSEMITKKKRTMMHEML